MGQGVGLLILLIMQRRHTVTTCIERVAPCCNGSHVNREATPMTAIKDRNEHQESRAAASDPTHLSIQLPRLRWRAPPHA